MKIIIRSILIGLTFYFTFNPLAEAGQYDLKEMTPAVESAIKNRQARYDQLQSLKASNVLGENNQGYVSILSGRGHETLVNAENQDRKTIYQAIANQNQLGPSGFGVIETVFADVQRDKAQPGESIQLTNGSWTQK